MELKNADANAVIASGNTGMIEFGLQSWNVKQLPSDLMEQVCMLEDKIELLLNYMWKFPGSLVCTA